LYKELEADAAAANPQSSAVCIWLMREFPSLEGYRSLRALLLCNVPGVRGLFDDGVPKLPPDLLELTLNGGPEQRLLASSFDPNPGPRDMPFRGVDLSALTAVTRLTLLGMTAPLLWGGLLGTGREVKCDDDRVPPTLRTLRVVEPAETADATSRIGLALMLRSSPPALPPARIPLLHVRADKVVCGHLQRWPAVPEPALPKAIWIQTQCLSLGLPGSELICNISPVASDHACGRRRRADARSVHPLIALCETLRSMPAGIEEIGVGFADSRQPLRLRLRLSSLPSVQPCTCSDEVSFATAAELADCMQQHAGEYGLSIRVVQESGDDYVVVCIPGNDKAAEQQACLASCVECLAELQM